MTGPFSFDDSYGARDSVEELASAEWLRREYVENERTQRGIADQLGCSQQAVCAALRRHGIEARPVARRMTRPIVVALETMGDEFDQITREMVAQLEVDRLRHPPSWSLVGRRFKMVTDVAQEEDEEWAQRMALIELASAAIMVADSKTPKRQ